MWRCWMDVVAAAVSGLVLSLPFTVYDGTLPACVALAPVLWLVAKAPTARRAGLLAGVFSVAWTAPSFSFLLHLIEPGVIALVVYTSLYYVAGLLAIRRVARWGYVPGVVGTAAIWVLVELARSRVPVFGFPWLLLGHTFSFNDQLRQGSDLFGVYGLSAVVVAINATLAFALPAFLSERWRVVPQKTAESVDEPARRTALRLDRYGAWKALCFAGMLWLMAWAYGELRVRKLEQRLEPGAPIGVIQGNVVEKRFRERSELDAQFAAHVVLHRELLKSAREKPVLVCWAETMVPGALNTDVWGPQFIALVKETGVPTFAGSNYDMPATPGQGDPHYCNTAYLIGGDGAERLRYFKRRLVPFGEYVPFTRELPFMKWLRSVTRDQYVPGTERSPVVEVGGYRVAANICIEDIHPDIAREAALDGATLLLNVTNDGWFYGGYGPRSHLLAARLRAVEVRRPFLRITNTGQTVAIDPLGRVQLIVPPETVATGTIRPLLLDETGAAGPRTLYMRLGEGGVALAALAVLLLGWLCRVPANPGNKAVYRNTPEVENPPKMEH